MGFILMGNRLVDLDGKSVIVTFRGRSPVIYRISPRTKMGKLKREFSRKVGRDVQNLRFCYKGDELIDEVRAEEMGFTHGDVINVYIRRR